MFGHQDDKKDQENQDGHEDAQKDAAIDTADPEQTKGQAPADSSASDDQPVSDDDAWQHAGDSSDEDKPEPEDDKDAAVPSDEADAGDDQPGPISDVIAPVGSGNAQNPVPPMPINARDIGGDGGDVPHELIDIKQKALNELQPLMGQLDQPPEERFRTLMMIIQASDNQDMIKQAYDVAEDIKDEKVRAQALLDLVNEINYFTQHSAN